MVASGPEEELLTTSLNLEEEAERDNLEAEEDAAFQRINTVVWFTLWETRERSLLLEAESYERHAITSVRYAVQAQWSSNSSRIHYKKLFDTRITELVGFEKRERGVLTEAYIDIQKRIVLQCNAALNVQKTSIAGVVQWCNDLDVYTRNSLENTEAETRHQLQHITAEMAQMARYVDEVNANAAGMTHTVEHTMSSKLNELQRRIVEMEGLLPRLNVRSPSSASLLMESHEERERMWIRAEHRRQMGVIHEWHLLELQGLVHENDHAKLSQRLREEELARKELEVQLANELKNSAKLEHTFSEFERTVQDLSRKADTERALLENEEKHNLQNRLNETVRHWQDAERRLEAEKAKLKESELDKHALQYELTRKKRNDNDKLLSELEDEESLQRGRLNNLYRQMQQMCVKWFSSIQDFEQQFDYVDNTRERKRNRSRSPPSPHNYNYPASPIHGASMLSTSAPPSPSELVLYQRSPSPPNLVENLKSALSALDDERRQRRDTEDQLDRQRRGHQHDTEQFSFMLGEMEAERNQLKALLQAQDENLKNSTRLKTGLLSTIISDSLWSLEGEETWHRESMKSEWRLAWMAFVGWWNCLTEVRHQIYELRSMAADQADLEEQNLVYYNQLRFREAQDTAVAYTGLQLVEIEERYYRGIIESVYSDGVNNLHSTCDLVYRFVSNSNQLYLQLSTLQDLKTRYNDYVVTVEVQFEEYEDRRAIEQERQDINSVMINRWLFLHTVQTEMEQNAILTITRHQVVIDEQEQREELYFHWEWMCYLFDHCLEWLNRTQTAIDKNREQQNRHVADVIAHQWTLYERTEYSTRNNIEDLWYNSVDMFRQFKRQIAEFQYERDMHNQTQKETYQYLELQNKVNSNLFKSYTETLLEEAIRQKRGIEDDWRGYQDIFWERRDQLRQLGICNQSLYAHQNAERQLIELTAMYEREQLNFEARLYTQLRAMQAHHDDQLRCLLLKFNQSCKSNLDSVEEDELRVRSELESVMKSSMMVCGELCDRLNLAARHHVARYDIQQQNYEQEMSRIRSQTQAQVEEMKRTCAVEFETVTELRQVKQELENRLNHFQQENSDNIDQCRTLRAQLDDTNRQLKYLESQLNDKRNEVQSKQNANSQLNSLLEEQQRKTRELMLVIEKKDEEKIYCEGESRKLQHTISEQQQFHDGVKRERDEWKSSTQQLQKKLTDSETNGRHLVDNITTLEADIRALKSERSHLDDRNHSLQQKINDHRQEISNLHRTIETQAAMHSEWERHLGDITHECQGLQSECERNVAKHHNLCSDLLQLLPTAVGGGRRMAINGQNTYNKTTPSGPPLDMYLSSFMGRPHDHTPSSPSRYGGYGHSSSSIDSPSGHHHSPPLSPIYNGMNAGMSPSFTPGNPATAGISTPQASIATLLHGCMTAVVNSTHQLDNLRQQLATQEREQNKISFLTNVLSMATVELEESRRRMQLYEELDAHTAYLTSFATHFSRQFNKHTSREQLEIEEQRCRRTMHSKNDSIRKVIVACRDHIIAHCNNRQRMIGSAFPHQLAALVSQEEHRRVTMYREVEQFYHFVNLLRETTNRERVTRYVGARALEDLHFKTALSLRLEYDTTHRVFQTWSYEVGQLKQTLSSTLQREAHIVHYYKAHSNHAMMHLYHEEMERRRLIEEWSGDVVRTYSVALAQLTWQDARNFYRNNNLQMLTVLNRDLQSMAKDQLQECEGKNRETVSWCQNWNLTILYEWKTMLHRINSQNFVPVIRLISDEIWKLSQTERSCRRIIEELALTHLEGLQFQASALRNNTTTIVRHTHRLAMNNVVSRLEVEEHCWRVNQLREMQDCFDTLHRWHNTVKDCLCDAPRLQRIECLEDVRAMNMFSLQEYRMREYQLWRQFEQERFERRLCDSRCEEKERELASYIQLTGTLKETIHDLMHQQNVHRAHQQHQLHTGCAIPHSRSASPLVPTNASPTRLRRTVITQQNHLHRLPH